MHDTGALQRVRHSVSAWVKLDLCLFRFVEQLLQLVHIRVLPHLQTNESRNKWAKFIRCPSWSFWLREGSGRKLGDGVKRWSCSFIWYSRASLEIQSGGQSDPDEFGRPATAFPIIRLLSMYLPSWICSARVLLIGPEEEQSVGSLIVEREAGCSVTTNKE